MSYIPKRKFERNKEGEKCAKGHTIGYDCDCGISVETAKDNLNTNFERNNNQNLTVDKLRGSFYESKLNDDM